MIFDAIVYFIVLIIFFLSSSSSSALSLSLSLEVLHIALSFVVGIILRWFDKMSRFFSSVSVCVRKTTTANRICINCSLQREQTSVVISLPSWHLESLYLQWFAAFEQRIDLFINSLPLYLKHI